MLIQSDVSMNYGTMDSQPEVQESPDINKRKRQRPKLKRQNAVEDLPIDDLFNIKSEIVEPEPEITNSPRKVETDIEEPQKQVVENTRNYPIPPKNDDPYNLMSGATMESWPNSSQ